MAGKLPDLEFRKGDDGIEWAVDVLVPGLIEASAAHRFGDTCIAGSRMPTWATWIWEMKDDPDALAEHHLTRDAVIAAFAFNAGQEWQKSRTRRKRMDQEVAELHERYAEKRRGDYEPGDETGW